MNGTETTRWHELLDANLAERDLLVNEIGERIRAELPAYRPIPEGQLGAALGSEFEQIMRAARTGREGVADEELADLAEIGEARARQGVPVGDMLLGWRIGVQVVLTHSRAAADRIGIEPGETLEFVQSLIAWSDRAMVIMTDAHRRAELDVARHDIEERGAFVRAVLLGTLPADQVAAQAGRHGLDPERDYFAVCCPAPDGGEAGALERALGFHETVPPRRGLSTTLDEELVGLLAELPSTPIEPAVGAGPARPLVRLPESFELAQRAGRTAGGFGLTGVRPFEQLGVLPAIADDPAVAAGLRRRYLDPLGGSAAAITETLRAYFECEANVRLTAERLHMHPNTVRYRIGRFEDLAGVSLRDPIRAFEVWWCLEAIRFAEWPGPSRAGW